MVESTFNDIWDAMRQDLPLKDILAAIDRANDDVFKIHHARDRSVTEHPFLLGAALAYHVDAAIVQKISIRTTNNFILSECLRDLTRLHCSREVVEDILTCIGFHESSVDYTGWLAYALNNERRAWFWTRLIGGKFLHHFYNKDPNIKQRVSRALTDMPPPCVQKIRALLDLPEGVE